jgi:hypothetical protein
MADSAQPVTTQTRKDAPGFVRAIGLFDGTMIVVEGGREHINQTVRIAVTSVLQTTAGKMIFGRFDERSHMVYDKERERPQREAAGGG